MDLIIPNTTAMVISGFPGVGKSYAERMNPNKFVDLESSVYHWEDPNSDKKVAKSTWPNNYIDAIEDMHKLPTELWRLRIEYNISKPMKYIFVSSHDQIRSALHARNIPYVNLVPQPTDEMKRIMIQRYHDRGSPSSFIDNMISNYVSYVNSLLNDQNASAITLLTPQSINNWYRWL